LIIKHLPPIPEGISFSIFASNCRIETWGRGIHRIFEACKTAGSPKPKVRYEPNDLWLEFPFSKTYLAAMAGDDFGGTSVENFGKKATKGSVKSSEKGSEETTVETPAKTPDRILEALKSYPEMTLAEVAKTIGLSKSAVERASAKLVKAGKLRHVGPTKVGHWKILK
jgi:ATP-dependent DNA helicase RecG